MNRYELYLFVHILAVLFWAGGGLMLLVIGEYAAKAGQDELGRWLGPAMAGAKYFPAAAMLALAAGLLMVFDGPWDVGEAWIVFGLAGFALSFVLGVGILDPQGKRLEQSIERAGRFDAVAAQETRNFMLLIRVDFTIILAIIAAMVFKPTGDDVALLVVLAAAPLVVFAATMRRIRARRVPAAAPAG